LNGFNNSSVSSAVPYSCVLVCNAYAEIGLLVMYPVCSLFLVSTDLSDCPRYE
jgi:hypothetical protein